jgi:hypothetical protein
MLKLTIDRADIIKYGAIMISVFPEAAKDLKLTNSTEEDFFGKLDLNDKTLELTINDEIVDRFMMRVAPMLIAAKNFNQSIAMRGLKKVDYAIMHGQFAFQAVGNEQHLNHNEDNYLSIVNEYIFVGHIHTFSSHDRILAQGSFDRLRQGQEEAKGYIRATVTDGSRKARFVENVGAMRFVTIDVTQMDIEDSLTHIRDRVDDLPAGSYVRIKANESHPIFANMPLLVREYTAYRWSKKQVSEDDEDGQEKFLDVTNADYNPIIITSDSIVDMVTERIRLSGQEEDFVCRCGELLLSQIGGLGE